MPSLLGRSQNPYYIVAPDYRRTSAGVRVMHLLCHALNQMGCEAYVLCNATDPGLRTPILEMKTKWQHLKLGLQPIYVYPEVVHGNPFRGNVVVRYLLNRPGFLGGDSSTFAETDLIFGYSRALLPEGQPDDQVLFLPSIDLTIFRPPHDSNKRRPGKICYYLGRQRQAVPEPGLLPPDAVEITQNFPASWEELADLFQQCEYFYCFESSGLTLEAALCGCVAVMVPNRFAPVVLVEEETGMFGVARGFDAAELERARTSLPLLREKLLEQQQVFWQTLPRFIDITQSAASAYQHGLLQAEAPERILFSVVICSINDSRYEMVRQNFEQALAGFPFEIIRIPDAKSLCEGYNRGFEQSRGEYILFSHDDIEILSHDFAAILLESFQQVDVVGAVGTELLSGASWSNSGKGYCHGHLAHLSPEGNIFYNRFDVRAALVTGIQALDGFFFAAKREVVAAVGFDAETFDSFHLYDIDFTYRAYLSGYALGVSNRLFFLHFSAGHYGMEWESYARRFYAKFDDVIEFMPPGKPMDAGIHCQDRAELVQQFETHLKRIDLGAAKPSPKRAYQVWREKTTLQEIDAQILAERMTLKWPSRPSVTLIMVAPHDRFHLLADTIDSLQMQFYKEWRLIVISDQPSPDPIFEETDVLGWLQIDTLTDSALLAHAVNEVSELVQSDWIALMPVGTQIEAHGLLTVMDYSHLHPTWSLMYTDHDHAGRDGYEQHRFKPDLNLELLRAEDYVGDTVFVRAEALKHVGGFLPYRQAENYDLLLRVADVFGRAAIGHIDQVLLHLPALQQENREAALSSALSAHLQRHQLAAEIRASLLPNSFRVVYPLEEEPPVSIVIPVRNGFGWLQPCLESLFAKTAYSRFQVIVVDQQSRDPELLNLYRQYLKEYPHRFALVEFEGEFSWSAMCNRGAQQATGEYLVFLNSDVQVVQREWLSNLIRHAARPEVGVVGARLAYPEVGGVQHAGMLLGMGTAGAGNIQSNRISDPGYLHRMQLDQEVSAVNGACLAISAPLFRNLGGFNAAHYPSRYGDVDLCLRVRQRDGLVIWCAHAVLVHLEAQTLNAEMREFPEKGRWIEQEREQLLRFFKEWGKLTGRDPYYNRHLSLQPQTLFQPERELVGEWDPNFHDRPRVLAMQPSGGVGEYRFFRPLQALAHAGRLQPSLVQTERYNAARHFSLAEVQRCEPDVLMRQSWFDWPDIEWQRLHREVHPHIRYVFMMDDLITKLPEKHPHFKDVPRDARFRLRQLLELADCLIVTTEPLRDLAQDMIGDVRLLPNRLAWSKWGSLVSKRRQGKKPRVGWAGAQQHGGDLELLREVVRATADEVEWVFMGMCPPELRKYVHEYREFEISVEAYPVRLAELNLDLALAPLQINEFNEAKSNLRLLEYGALGWPVICTDVYPYRTNNAPVHRLPNDSRLWIEAIRELIADPDALAKQGDRLRDWVWTHYKLEDHLDEWFDALVGR